jgi:hypothetical protein
VVDVGSRIEVVVLVVSIAWSSAVVLAVGTALLARNPKQRADARTVLTYLLRTRRLPANRDE